MSAWYRSDEFEMPLWVLDLDQDLYSLRHRRLCVWFDELNALWRWEIQTYEHSGVAAAGDADSEQTAKAAAEASVRLLHAAHAARDAS